MTRPDRETAEALISATQDAAAQIDVAVVAATRDLDTVEQEAIRLILDALLAGGRYEHHEVWRVRVDRALAAAYGTMRRRLIVKVDQTLRGVSHDLALALAAITHSAEPLAAAEQTLAHLGSMWRLGIRGMTLDVQQKLAQATGTVRDGQRDLPRAVADAANDLLNLGVRQFRDSLGRRWRPATYSHMVIRTACMSAHQAACVVGAQETGTPFLIVSDAHRECPRCARWEHAILTVSQPVTEPARATLAEAKDAGLFHPQCRHIASPWYPEYDAIRKPTQHNAELYAASQTQRRLEREIRELKTRAQFSAQHSRLYGSTGSADLPLPGPTMERVREKQAELRDLVAKWPKDLKRTYWREQPRPGD